MRFWPRLVVTGLVAVLAAAGSWLVAETAGGQVAAWAAAGIAATVVVTLGAVWASREAGQHRPKVDKRRADRRARFASAMVEQVASISRLEEWQDDRFAELDAEVEIHGRQRRGLLRRRRRETIRRVPSLSRAMERSSERIILLEGEPGSGKSVALRHVAIRLASRLRDHPSGTGVIPIYLNLKEFRPAFAVDAGAIRDFLRSSINRANDRYVEIFLDEEFDRGVEDGTWLFLFDSFDEIPAILGATEADEVIEQYAGALYDFLVTGMNACRGIIASREFRGPKRINWTRFRVLRLTDPQRRDLIAKLDLPRETENRLLAGLAVGDAAVRQLADNPLFLALLCEHQRGVAQFPANSHVVFEDYVAKRFKDDSGRLMNRYGIDTQSVRGVAEQAAYCMASRPGLGLSPLRDDLIAQMRDAGFAVDETTAVALDALEFVRLARAVETVGGQAGGFTFAHRRFQEYFATCFVMLEGSRVEPLSLLTDGRWRETAVTLLQTQDKAATRPLLDQAESLLAVMAGNGQANRRLAPPAPGAGVGYAGRPFDWPPGSLHLLGIVQDGLPTGDSRRSPGIEALAGRLLIRAYEAGQLHDKRWVVEVCLAATAETACDILRAAFDSGSGWLREAAYEQAGRLDEFPDDLRRQMRGVLAGLAAGGQLRQQRLAVDAQLQRLPDPRPERLLVRLFLVTPLVDAMLLTAVVYSAVVVLRWHGLSVLLVVCAAVLMHGVLYVDRGTRQLDVGARYSGGLAWFYALMDAIVGYVSPPTMAELTIAARVGVAYSLFWWPGVAIRAHHSVLLPTILVLAAWFYLSWGPSAVRADRILDQPTLLKIVILPLEVPRYYIKLHRQDSPSESLWQAIRKAHPFVSLLRAVRRITVIKLARFVATVIMLPVIFAFGLAVAGVLLAAGLAVMPFVIVHLIAQNVHKRWEDHGLERKIGQGGLSLDDFNGMFSTLTRFRTEGALLLFMQDVRRRRITADHPTTLRALQAFVSLAQSDSRDAEPPSDLIDRLDPVELEEVRRWKDNPARNLRNEVGQAVVDEVGKMVADSEARARRGP